MSLTIRDADRILTDVFAAVEKDHKPEGIGYIRAHWQRYLQIMMLLPQLPAGARVLEIGASIMSNVMYTAFDWHVETVYHELEPEWKPRFERAGITAYPVEILRDPLPVDNSAFDLILLDQVLEHLPVAPDFLVRQCISKLGPKGQLLIAVPNFATSEKRLALLLGKNPQDPMDNRYIYYAHHREPVMDECLDLAVRCGGNVDNYEWIDFEAAPGAGGTLLYLLRCLKHRRWHRIIHLLVPSMRSFLFLRIRRASSSGTDSAPVPPLQMSGEFGVSSPAGMQYRSAHK